MVVELQEQRNNLNEQEQELNEVEKKIQEQEKEAKKAAKQEIPQKRYGSTVTKEQQLAVKENRTRAMEFLAQIKEPRTQIQAARQKIQSARSTLDSYDKEKHAFTVAKKYYYKRTSSNTLKRLGEDPRVVYYVKRFEEAGEEAAEAQAQSRLRDLESSYNRELTEAEKARALDIFRFQAGTGDETPIIYDIEEGKSIPLNLRPLEASVAPENIGTFLNPPQPEQKEWSFQYSFKYYIKQPAKPVNVVDAVPTYQQLFKEGKYEQGTQTLVTTAKFNPTQIQRDIGTKAVPVAVITIGAGVISSYLGTYRFIKEQGKLQNNILLKPYTQTLSIAKNPAQVTQLPTNIGNLAYNTRVTAEQKPLFAFGYATGEASQLVAPTVAGKGIVKVTDLSRTLKTTKLAPTEIIAPEYFKGQKYPTIAYKETAGELLKEFSVTPKGFPKTGGFTAAPKPIQTPIVGKGSSELPGLYQAPRLSPAFLRVTGEKSKLIGPDIIPTLRPTAFFITPTKYELIPGVKSSQKSLTPLKTAKSFYKDKAELGKSYVPFIKTEKEAIITPGTELLKTGRRFSFKFEGRTIPIDEYITVNAKKTKPFKFDNKKVKTVTTKDIMSYSSKGRLKPTSYVSPFPASYSVGKALSSSYAVPKFSSSVAPISSSSALKSSTSYASASKSVASYKPYGALSSGTGSSVSNYYTGYYGGYGYGGGGYGGGGGGSSGGGGNGGGGGGGGIWAPGKYYRTKARRQTGIEGYRTLVKVRGKYKALPGIRVKGAAIKLGAEKTLKTLSASFKVEKAGKKIQAPRFNYRPPTSLFRGYKITKGKKAPLIDTYIQKRGTRLGRRSEVKAIQLARVKI